VEYFRNAESAKKQQPRSRRCSDCFFFDDNVTAVTPFTSGKNRLLLSIPLNAFGFNDIPDSVQWFDWQACCTTRHRICRRN
jgi:hypothetical protein